MNATPSPAMDEALPGMMLMGAQSRLLPSHIPFRFFAAAAVFQVVAWVLLALGADTVDWFVGGPGLPLAALHALTLGVLAMTAMGASLQLLTVATGVALGSLAPIRLASWLYIPGTAVLVFGMAIGDVSTMIVGGISAVAGLGLFFLLVADLFRRAKTLRLVIRHGWGALVSLALLALLGLTLIADFEFGLLGDTPMPTHGATAAAHAILGGYGFMGLLALGFSYVLVPMFALSPPAETRWVRVSLILVVSGLTLGTAGVLSDHVVTSSVIVTAVAIGIVGVGVHLGLMLKALRGGMKKRLGLSFALVKTAWVLLPCSLLLGGVAAIGAPGPSWSTMFGFIMVFGWLLTFLLGVLQRILPFLASMHAHRLGTTPPRLSELGEGSILLKIHAAGHAAALILVTGGIAFEATDAIAVGGVIGGLGALAFLWFTVDIARHLIATRSKAPPSPV